MNESIESQIEEAAIRYVNPSLGYDDSMSSRELHEMSIKQKAFIVGAEFLKRQLNEALDKIAELEAQK